ncbi:MAG: IreB family regulatory phosphoprotein [Bacilli bacterium]|nr:IreB family regulatory phosphoprotein [Bacilli bacterium]
MEQTSLFDVKLMKEELIKATLKEVSTSLNERGYDAQNQLAGYLISGDPGFISNYQEARSKILELDRSEIVKFLLDNYMGK